MEHAYLVYQHRLLQIRRDINKVYNSKIIYFETPSLLPSNIL